MKLLFIVFRKVKSETKRNKFCPRRRILFSYVHLAVSDVTFGRFENLTDISHGLSVFQSDYERALFLGRCIINK